MRFRYQVLGPEWLENERFDIAAKIPKGATEEQFSLMMQSLLEERFQLVVHHESKQIAGYDLVVGKNGPKMKEHADVPASQRDTQPPEPTGVKPKFELGKDGLPARPVFGGTGTHTLLMRDRGRMWASGETMPHLAGMLSNQLGKTVTDATGLTGKYDFVLSWRTESTDGPPTEDASDPAAVLPTLTSAVQEQLGLKLEAKKANVDVLVVDHAEKVPAGN